MKTKLLLFQCLLYLLAQGVVAQAATQDARNGLPLEKEDMPYTYIDRNKMQTSKAYNRNATTFFTRQVNVNSGGDNMMNDAANEPSIAVDPTNPDRVVIGWRQFDDISSNFRQAGYGFSVNGGEVWTFPGVLEPGVFRSDPVLDFDKEGNFYYNSLQTTFECDVFAIRDGGVVWGDPVPANGGDKQWMRIDRSEGPGAGHNYSYWNESFTTCQGSFTRSTDEALSFEDCEQLQVAPFWGTLAVDATSNLYITGRFGLDVVVMQSRNAQDAGSLVTFEDPTIVDLDGVIDVQDPINPQGLLGQAWVDVDVSNGPGRDNVYVVSTVSRNSNNDPADVMFARSSDGGASFEPAIRINTDDSETNYQWFGTMAVAPNGRIDVIWLDTRNANGGFDSVLYYSFSTDQGDTWSENLPISESFDPSVGYPQQQKMGDYFDMKSDDEFAHIAWCATFTGGQDVYYTRVTPDDILSVDETVYTDTSLQVFPNPIQEQSTIRFYAEEDQPTFVSIIDLTGREVMVLLDQKVSGKQELVWNATDRSGNKVSSGIYFIHLRRGSQTVVHKVLVK